MAATSWDCPTGAGFVRKVHDGSLSPADLGPLGDFASELGPRDLIALWAAIMCAANRAGQGAHGDVFDSHKAATMVALAMRALGWHSVQEALRQFTVEEVKAIHAEVGARVAAILDDVSLDQGGTP